MPFVSPVTVQERRASGAAEGARACGVAGDRRATVGERGRPGQHHLPVAAYGRDERRRAGHGRGSRRERSGGAARADGVGGGDGERIAGSVRQPGDRAGEGAGGGAGGAAGACGDGVAGDRRAAVRAGSLPGQRHQAVAAHGGDAGWARREQWPPPPFSTSTLALETTLTLPAISVATALSVWIPFGTVLELQA